ncbi:helix-turn-helix domain-containing protein [Streptomyces sp. IB2014 016-6]|uniref:helix-turn-helix domain-containing protein n=1 Tax=Streptomyces sp. IB2014 016-6 TaxID=2517818 RepID=UPI0019D62388|nr:helix-turn-helix domain-containing protein [Streptomyces sp. IB2014 016-6]
MSAQGRTVKDITSLMQVGEDHVRDVSHAFNERGFDALDPKWSGGRPRTVNERVRERICLIARTSPADRGLTGFATWSLSKLADHLVQRHVVPKISRETLRRILRSGKISWQATTTWKASTDPNFIAKMHGVLALYDTPPAGGRVICVDESNRSSRPCATSPSTAPTAAPTRNERRHRRLHPPAQHPRRAQDQLRPRLVNPPVDGIPVQGCMTSHEEWSGRFSINALRGMLRAGRSRP